MSKKRRKFTAEEKVELIRRHIKDHVPISELCDEVGIQPSLLYRWIERLLQTAPAALDGPKGRPAVSPEKKLAEKVKRLEAKLAAKDAVIAEVSEEYVRLKKELGEL